MENRRWFVLLLLAMSGCVSPGLLPLSDGIVLRVPKGWTPVVREGAPVTEIALVGPGGTVQARIALQVEDRASAREAVDRLRQIAVETDVPARYGTIGGWPALVRTRSAPLPLPSRWGGDEKPRAGKSQTILVVTTAVAADARVVRLEGWLSPTADRALAGAVERVAADLVLPFNRDHQAVRRDLDWLAQAQVSLAEAGAITPSDSAAAALAAGGRAVLVNPGIASSEISVATDGANVVIGTNAGGGGYAFSLGGAFTLGAAPFGFPTSGDPSVAASPGVFYFALLGRPAGTAAAGGVTGCTVSVSVSTDGGANFNFAGHAVVCGLNGAALLSCFPDQEHIASDPVDGQLYAAWRDFHLFASPPSCTANTPGIPFAPALACSTNRGAAWIHRRELAPGGDRARIAVAGNGEVFVLWVQGANVMLSRFTSCTSGFNPVPGFPVLVATIRPIPCPPGLAGLDRCDNMSSPMVAVDDIDPAHIYVGWAQNTAPDNDNILVKHSGDGGRTFSPAFALNTPARGRRFMPWICSTAGGVHAGWYDRRAATATTMDATAYFSSSATPVLNGPLAVGPEVNLSGITDAQCATGFPSGNRQLTQCCPPLSCASGGGVPKWGDYNGNACGPGGLVVSAWASVTVPTGLAVPAVGAGTIRTFADRVRLALVGCGDGLCNPALENCGNCPADCGCLAGMTCSHRVCTPGICGDGVCNLDKENCGNCGGDCPCPPTMACVSGLCQVPAACGDGVCTPGVEDCANCAADCGCPAGMACVNSACSATACGDARCDLLSGESCASCGGDCGCPTGWGCVNSACQIPAACGNGICTLGVEHCGNCAADCGCPFGISCVNGVCI